jgi:hypothetical protein
MDSSSKKSADDARVKEEQQELEEGTHHSIGAGIKGNASQCSSSNLEDSNEPPVS